MNATVEDDRHTSLEDHEFKGSTPMTRMLNDLARTSTELADDWLFERVSPEMQLQMMAERGLKVSVR